MVRKQGQNLLALLYVGSYTCSICVIIYVSYSHTNLSKGVLGTHFGLFGVFQYMQIGAPWAILFAHTPLFLGTHSNLFRTCLHTQRGALGQIIGPAAFILLWFCPFYVYMDSIFVVIISLPFYLYYLYTHTHSLCVVVSLKISLLHTHTHILCVQLFFLYLFISMTQIHTHTL